MAFPKGLFGKFSALLWFVKAAILLRGRETLPFLTNIRFGFGGTWLHASNTDGVEQGAMSIERMK